MNDLVEAIKDGIDRSAAVLADLTADNPNVWYELGHAIAKSKPFCLICSDERTGSYPFDIGHLKVLHYKTGSLSDFQKLNMDITARLKAVHTQGEQLKALSNSISSLPSKDGLDSFEQVALSLVFEEHLEGGITSWALTLKMEKAGFTKVATNLGVVNLMKKGLVEKQERERDDNETYEVLAMTHSGIEWIQSHPQDLVLHTSARIRDDDIPF